MAPGPGPVGEPVEHEHGRARALVDDVEFDSVDCAAHGLSCQTAGVTGSRTSPGSLLVTCAPACTQAWTLPTRTSDSSSSGSNHPVACRMSRATVGSSVATASAAAKNWACSGGGGSKLTNAAPG